MFVKISTWDFPHNTAYPYLAIPIRQDKASFPEVDHDLDVVTAFASKGLFELGGLISGSDNFAHQDGMLLLENS